MVKVIATFLLLSTLISNASARDFVCEGYKNLKKVVFKGKIPSSSLLDLGKASGSVTVNNLVVMTFETGDLDVSLFRHTFKTTTNQGDVLDGKVTDLTEKTGIINKLISPSYGIAMFDIPVQCR